MLKRVDRVQIAVADLDAAEKISTVKDAIEYIDKHSKGK